MEYTTFRQELQQRLEVLAGSDAVVQIVPVFRNNGGLQENICVRTSIDGPVPAVDLRRCFRECESGKKVEDIAEKLWQTILCTEVPEALSEPGLFRYDWACKRLGFRLISKEKNADLLHKVPYQTFLDLAIVCQITFGDDTDRELSTLVTTELLNNWEISKDRAFRQAAENTCSRTEGRLSFMEEILAEYMGDDIFMPIEQERTGMGLMVLTNRTGHYGAAQILNTELLEQASRHYGGDFWIFPSSVHEWILAPPELGQDFCEMENMVREINDTQVPEEDILSYHVYRYDAGNRQVLQA